MHNQDLFLEQALIDEGVVSPAQVEALRERVRTGTGDFVDALIDAEILNDREVALLKADICEVPYVDLSDFDANYQNTSLVPRAVAERYDLFPLFYIDGVLTLAMDDPLNLDARDQVRQIARCEVDAVLVDRTQLRQLIKRAYSLGRGEHLVEEDPDAEVVGPDESQPAVAAVNQLVAEAVEQNASDVHINPDEFELRIRYRIDGVLHEKQGPAKSMHPAIVQRLKVMASLDITQTRRPQDGKFRFVHHGQPVDVRVSTVPTVCGENVVIRLLHQTVAVLSFEELGVPIDVREGINDVLERPYGILLVTGPTGSGKTTTLYASLNVVNSPERNIMTIEDPVELKMPYVRQIQVRNEIGLTFANALRSVLRQDPDVVMVGEIRDEETANIALQAALTGHLVLATLHTNDAPGGIARLRDFGIAPFIINSAVLGVMAQRLVRRVCPSCVAPYDPDQLTLSRFGIEDERTQFQCGAGCGRCTQTGFRGRIGIFEFLHMDADLHMLVERGRSSRELRDEAVRHGMRLMWQDGLEKARRSVTTLEEVAKAAAISHINENLNARKSA